MCADDYQGKTLFEIVHVCADVYACVDAHVFVCVCARVRACVCVPVHVSVHVCTRVNVFVLDMPPFHRPINALFFGLSPVHQ